MTGSGVSIGASAAYGLALGVDVNIIPKQTGGVYKGVTFGFGLGTPGGEVHAEVGNTSQHDGTEFNIFNEWDKFYEKEMNK